jgi:hypothetical protein
METVQLAVRDSRYAVSLREMLERGGNRHVECVEVPDLRHDGVIVVDPDGLDRLPSPLLYPERVVLITRNDPHNLAQAWNAGIRSVVFSEDPLSTAVLAIMAAELRIPKPDPRWALPQAPHGPGGSGAAAPCEHRPVAAKTAANVPDVPVRGSKPQKKEGLK